MSDSSRPHGLQPTRLLCPWDFPGKSTGVGFVVIQSCPTLATPKSWSFSFSIIPSKEHPGLISSRMDWLDLLAVQGTLKSLLQHHSSKASNLTLTQSINSILLIFLSFTHSFFQRRQWHPTPVLLPGKSHGRRSLVGCSPWGR